MGLLNKLIDKVIDSAKKKKVDSVIAKLAKENPAFGKKVVDHQRSYKEMRDDLYKLLRKKGLRP